MPGCWFLMGCSVKPSPALDLYITVKTDRRTCKPLLSWPWPRQEPRVAGWVGRWAPQPKQCNLVHYVQQRVAAARQESWVPLSDALLHRIHRDVVVIASDCQVRL